MKSFLFVILSFMWFLPCSQGALSPSGAQTEEMEVEGQPQILYLGTFYVNSDGRVKETLVLDGNDRYFFLIRDTVVYGKVNNSDLAKMDACYEFGINWKDPVLMPSIGNNAGISTCDTGYHSDHVYQSVIFQGIDAVLTFWMVDITYDNNIGRLAVQLYRMKRESPVPPVPPTPTTPTAPPTPTANPCTCVDRYGGGIDFGLARDGRYIDLGLGWKECNDLRKSHPQCRLTSSAPPAPPAPPANHCICRDRYGGGIEYWLVRDGRLLQRGLGFSECVDLRKNNPQCK